MVDTLFVSLAGITAAFIILLAVKSLSGWKYCVLCAAVTATWVALLSLHYLAIFKDPVILSILMGGSSVGIYYLVEKKTNEQLHVFRVPFFLTMILIGYELVARQEIGALFKSVLLLIVLWVITAFLHIYRQKPGLRSVVSKILECCKNW